LLLAIGRERTTADRAVARAGHLTTVIDVHAEHHHVTLRRRRTMGQNGSLKVSEIFESIQGEGPSAGTPSIFVRLALCNLRCRWCDTKYTWDWTHHRYEEEVKKVSVAEVAERIERSTAAHVVVTGGEPLLQQPALVALLGSIARGRYVEVETNGTVPPTRALAERVDQWNVSPKLSNSGEPPARRLRTHALRTLLETGRAWLKLVIDVESDAAEAAQLVAELGWPKSRVLYMAQASTRADLVAKSRLVSRLAERSAVGISPRLHVEKWEGRRGV
jgi:7-carboxy-7-deazaguanine synthase